MSTHAALPVPAQAEALAAALRPVDPEPWIAVFVERFEMPREIFQDLVFFQANRKFISVVNAEHIPVARLRPEMVGMDILRVAMVHPKITTAGALTFGRFAQKHVVDLDACQARAYLARHTILLEEAQCARCQFSGHVIVRHEGVALGVAFLNLEPRQERLARTLESYFPKAWALHDGTSPDDGEPDDER